MFARFARRAFRTATPPLLCAASFTLEFTPSIEDDIQLKPFKVAQIKSWFDSNIYTETPAFEDTQNQCKTASYYSTYFILNHALQSKTNLTDSISCTMHANHSQLSAFWNRFEHHLFSSTADAGTHKLFHVRIDRQADTADVNHNSSVHEFIIERVNSHYLIYQSCWNAYGLDQWLGYNPKPISMDHWLQPQQEQEQSVKSYIETLVSCMKCIRDKYGNSKLLTRQDMHEWMDNLRKCCDLKMENELSKSEMKRDATWDEGVWYMFFQQFMNVLLYEWQQNDGVIHDAFFHDYREAVTKEFLQTEYGEEVSDADIENTNKVIQSALSDVEFEFASQKIFGFRVPHFVDTVSVDIYDLTASAQSDDIQQEQNKFFTFRRGSDFNVFCCDKQDAIKVLQNAGLPEKDIDQLVQHSTK